MRTICVLGFLIASAAGAGAGEYYIVQDSATKQCTIVDSPPATTQFVLIDNGRVFAAREDAQRTAASLTLCSSRTPSADARPTGQDNKTTQLEGRTAAKKPNAGRTAHAQAVRSRRATLYPASTKRRATIQPQSIGSRAAAARAAESREPFSSFFTLFR